MNAVAEAALIRMRRSLNDLRSVVRGLPAEGLNWRPGEATNSIAAQVAHVLKSANFLLSAAHSKDGDLNAYLKEREEAFHFSGDERALLEMLDAFDRRLPARLADIDEHDLADIVGWQGGPWEPASVAWCLLGVVEHLREHVGAAALTRQLWEQRDRR
ncbi:MAG TPA: DinB family protein [Dehalococcoidia bacterium]|nr:DinB family protein [Dehalococcoidia bacterium]